MFLGDMFLGDMFLGGYLSVLCDGLLLLLDDHD